MTEKHIISVNFFDRSHALPEKWVERERFIREHHHLITPLLYSPTQIAQRDAILLARHTREALE